MRFVIKEWTVLQLFRNRNRISFPVYQRGNVWSDGKRALLIDSILKGIDIPKLYLQRTDEGWDCIDGNQRIKAIVSFIDGDLKVNGKTFSELKAEEKRRVEEYRLTITEVEDITEEEVRELFIRLQLGVPVNSGERLNAISSNLGEFVKKMVTTQFVRQVNITTRRFAKEQVCAQICNNSRYINRTGEFRDSKYEDLENLYRGYKDFDLNSLEARGILSVLEKLNNIFSTDAAEIKSRAAVVSIYLLLEEMILNDTLTGKELLIKKFYLEFLREIKRQVKLGIDATNRFLINYQSKVIQAADSKASIRDRHEKLKEAFDFYLSSRKIKSE